MAFLKSIPLTFTGIPRLPEDTVQSCKTSQVVFGRVLGISLGPILGEEEGNVDIDGLYEG
jgi:hypothetical protein